MNTLRTTALIKSTSMMLSCLIALALVLATPVEAAPRFRASIGGFNPDTGNFGRVAGGVNRDTGARYLRASRYDAATGTFQRSTRAFNPSTGQGFTANTTAAQGAGLTTNINTVNNGSYTCTVSRGLPTQCIEQSSSL